MTRRTTTAASATASAIASGVLPERIERERRRRSGAFAFTAAAPASSLARTVRARMCVAPQSSLPEIRWKLRFARRCLEAGLCHVLADDVARRRTPSRRPTSAMPRVRRGRCVAPAARSRGLSVIVDARILSQPMTGTQLHVIEVIAALARTGNVQVAGDRDRPHRRGGGSEPRVGAGARRSCATPTRTQMAKADVVHRPFQLDNPGDLSFLTSLADRVVITQQDLIGYQNPSYFASRDAWEGYRELTRTALAVADRVLFFSQHARARSARRGARRDRTCQRGRARRRPPDRRRRPSHPRRCRGSPADTEVMLLPGQRLPPQEPAVRAADARRADYQAWLGGPAGAGRPPRTSRLIGAGGAADAEHTPGAGRGRGRARCGERGGKGVAAGPRRAWCSIQRCTRGSAWFRSRPPRTPSRACGRPAHRSASCSTMTRRRSWHGTRRPAPTARWTLMRDARERERNVEPDPPRRRDPHLGRGAARLLEVYEQTCDAPAAAAGVLFRSGGLISGASPRMPPG